MRTALKEFTKQQRLWQAKDRVVKLGIELQRGTETRSSAGSTSAAQSLP
jgi:hypothetical protein